MKQLERVYLANVLLYFTSIESIIKFKMINKKCQESTDMIRYFEAIQITDEGDEEITIVPNNLFQIYPNIETVKCSEKELYRSLEVLDNVKRIELTIGPNYKGNKKGDVIFLHLKCYSINTVKLKEFPKVKKVKLSYLEGSLEEFLGDYDLKLEKLIIYTQFNEDLYCLRNYKNIRNIILIIDNSFKEIGKESYEELKQFLDIKLTKMIEGTNPKQTLWFDIININEKDNITELYTDTLFTKCFVKGKCELRGCELLESVDTVFKSDSVSLKIKGLRNLKEIHFAKHIDSLPSNVSSLSICDDFNFKELEENDVNCFSNIKKLEIMLCGRHETFDNSIINSFVNCNTVDIQCWNKHNVFTLPISLRKLVISCYYKEEQLKEISKLVNLKVLVIRIIGQCQETKSIQKMFNTLCHLEHLETESLFIKTVSLPKNITSLSIEIQVDDELVDLSKFKKLKEIEVFTYEDKEKIVKLPKRLDLLRIKGSISVTNKSKTQTNKLVLECTNPQLSQIKAKSILIIS